ncbi:mechanosensitive ion channel domain-containing protein [Hoeflea sp.]|uniref:mechanosensitive ion channel domain-containing protein n=1 Tax=Hoeflea sp. TaxID=1940281 RepID=UPI003B5232E6
MPFARYLSIRVATLFLGLLLVTAAFTAAGPALAQNPLAATSGSTASDAPADDPSGDRAAVIDPLLEVLKDDAARQELIDALEATDVDASEEEAGTTEAEAPGTVAAQLAAWTKSAIDETLDIARKFAADLSGLASLFDGSIQTDWSRFTAQLLPLLATVVIAVALYALARRMLRTALAPSRARLGDSGILAAVALVALHVLAEIVALAVGYFAAGALAATMFGPGSVTIYQTLFLNAFLVAGVTAIIIRTVTGIVNGDYPVLRRSPALRQMLRERAIRLSGLLIFGIAFVVPATNALVSFTVGRSVRVLIYTLAALYAVKAIRALSSLQQEEAKKPASATPDPEEEGDAVVDEALPQPVQSAFMQIWPWIAYLYVAASYVIALSRPALFVDFVGGATLKTAAALVLGGLVLRASGHLSTRTIHAPSFLPLDQEAFSARLTSFVPIIMRVVWLLVGLAILAVVLDAWAIVDIGAWLQGERGSALVAGLTSSLIVILVCVLVWAVASSWIDRRMENVQGSALVSARYRTLYSLLKNALTVALVIFGGMIALSELGIDIGPLLAGAGVLGLAIGFGAQKLVQDIISGVFIQLENAMNVGDVVGAGGITGVVERLTLRSVSLRDLSGVYHIIPFSSVDSVSNYMRNFAYHIEEVGIAYKESVEEGKAAMHEAFDRLMETSHKSDILEPLEMHGVTGLGDSAVLIRARIKTAPGMQWDVGRAYTELVKQVMDERDIEIPFPHTTLYLGRDKQGRTDELPIRMEKADTQGSKTAPETDEKG